jgi:NAD(P)-dependent dehydrogenase (short-subunit alcohol dehydrogenase family)
VKDTLAVDLNGVVAVVTGASRGAGRAIAAVVGEAGATVYLTGRSLRGRPSVPGRSGTLEETLVAVAQRGGLAIPVRCDHTSETDVARVFSRVRDEQGRLDLLVNNVWGGYEQRPGQPEVPFFDAPFWEQPLWRWEAMFDAGVRAHFLASRFAAPLMIERLERRDTAKAATARLAFGTAQQLRPHSVAVVAIAPGHLGVTESPEYLGRAIATLAADPAAICKAGELLSVGELAREFGFTDVDGTQPEAWRV